MKQLLFLVVIAISTVHCGAYEADSELESAVPTLVNALADQVISLIGKDREGVEASIIGHALPTDKQPFDLQGWTQYEETFEKLLESTLGTNLVFLRYKVAYQYGGSVQGKGRYIANVKFTPLKVEEDLLWSLQVTSLSEQPINEGTVKSPVANLRFSITFTASGLGKRGATDEFSINGATGELTREINELQ